MQNVSCPSCGAQVEFRSHASVLAVCEYCKTTILKDANSVKDLGKMSSVLEDYSPIQIGTSGEFAGNSFTVIGRIQLRYSAGMWNEWYVLFGDGKAAWLGDASGLYTLTTERQSNGPLPAFADLAPGRTYLINEKNCVASDIRTAECIGGQGELPFKVGGGYQIRVGDFRFGKSFLTLDYSDNDQPVVYSGFAVTLEELKCQLLRDDEQVKTSAGKFKGKIDSLSCPSCGSSISYLPGLTAHIVCPSCSSQVNAAGPTAEVLAAAERMEKVHTTLELGAKAKINGADFQIIGLMRVADDENTEWVEYLMYSARSGFLWLIETDEGWARSKVLDEWPVWNQGESATVDNTKFTKLYDYTAQVVFAAGAFNWRVSVGDTTDVTEFENGQNKLAAEMTAEEITWSQSSSVPADQIRAWFGKAINADKKAPAANTSGATKFIYWILGLNAIPLLMSFKSTWFLVLLAVAAIYLPAKFLAPSTKGDQ